MNPSSKLFVIAFPFLIFAFACSEKKTDKTKEYKLNQPLTVLAPYDEGYPLTDEEVDLTALFKTKDYEEHYSQYFKDKVDPPPFDFNVDISKKSFHELRMLRAEIMARHGFLFMDYVSRSHFNATNWYKPVFWYDNFKIKLNDQEKTFIDKVLKRETELYAKNYITVNGYKAANPANVVNWQQYESIPEKMKTHLNHHGFVINSASYEQLFHAYDENYYDYTPSFITTDLYLQVLHMHISKEMQALELDKLSPLIKELLEDQYTLTQKAYSSAKNTDTKKALAWNQTYYAIALSLITGQKQKIPNEMQMQYDYELEHIEKAEGLKSDFLGDSLLNYEQFTPRGNYSRNDSLKKYFRCTKWLNMGGLYIDSDEGMKRAILLGKTLLNSSTSYTNYQTFSNVIQFLAGYENNLSFMHLLDALENYKAVPAEQLLTGEMIDKIRTTLYKTDPKRMFAKGANKTTNEFLSRKKVLFTAGRYTFDAEILQRLVNIERQQLSEEPKRAFPKGLDVFASMNNKTAEQILLQVYKEQQDWPAYTDTLAAMKKKFSSFNDWDISIYNQQMKNILSFQQKNPAFPYFMQQPLWEKKNLNTMLASWTGLKHDMLLYVEQPNASEMGDGGEIPPPQKIAYVEPHVAFWKNCIALLELNEKLLKQNNFFTEKLQYRNDELKKLAGLFYRVSEKELKGQKVSNLEFDTLSFVGGNIEHLTLEIIESPEAFITSVSTPDRYMAIAADVYNYNGHFLEEAVGMGDEIYVMAEINGLLYLTRGAVFSQYEFIESSPLTDEQWQERLLKNEYPDVPVWMNDIKIQVTRPKVAANFNLY